MNKKGVSIPILLLVISCLIITAISLTYFIIKDRDIDEGNRISTEIDVVYLEQMLLNFYLQDVFDKSLIGFNGNKQDFLNSFRIELLKYKDKEGKYPIDSLALFELKMLNEDYSDRVLIRDNEIVFTLDLQVKRGHTVRDSKLFMTYNYIKEFGKVFK